ncbi:MAG TPA: M23 family metallopeptidase [Nocardioides sp.]|nr:M23 family metallopeptidase [Nocardioides sp.]
MRPEAAVLAEAGGDAVAGDRQHPLVEPELVRLLLGELGELGQRGVTLPGLVLHLGDELGVGPVGECVAALAISAGGAITATNGGLDDQAPRFSQASALSGASDVSRVSLLDRETVSRDSRRDALDDKADAKLVAEVEDQARQRDAALAKLTQLAQQQADKLRLNQWVLPLSGYRITASFGEYSGLWSHYHTGLDFAAPSGTPIVAIANGVVTSVGYDGAYGNKTVITLDDGTELWFCHQTSYTVSAGQEVRAGEVIGYVGSTGNVTGPHLHLEVRPGAGDPVDPYEAMVVHGLTP